MKVVKLTTPWQLTYRDQSPGGQGVWEDYRFEINNACDEADYWFIWGGLLPGAARERVRVPRGNVAYITDEAHDKRVFSQGFLNQFPTLCTPRRDLFHRHAVPYQEIAPWYLPANFDEMAALPVPAKTRDLGLITSDLLFLENHKHRFAFVHQMIGHFKARLDAYGRGIRPIANKFEAYLPYRYAIALENTALDDYFTEKPREPFLCYAMPLYWGCPNLEAYFDADSFLRLDLYDYQASIAVIEEAIAQDAYRQRFDLICRMRERVLYRYHLFPALTRFIEQHLAADGPPAPVRILSEQTWVRREYNPVRRFFLDNPLTRQARQWLRR